MTDWRWRRRLGCVDILNFEAVCRRLALKIGASSDTCTAQHLWIPACAGMTGWKSEMSTEPNAWYSQCVLVLETSIVSDRVDSRLRGDDGLEIRNVNRT